MKLSILIPAINIHSLQQCLRAIDEHSTFGHEILVHVNSLNEKDLSLFKELELRYKGRGQFVYSKQNYGVCMPLNNLAKKAKNEWIIYIADDEIVLPKWDIGIDEYIKNLTDTNYFLVPRRIERIVESPMFSGIQGDFGDSYESIMWDKLKREAESIIETHKNDKLKRKAIIPFLMTKTNYLECGGYDVGYYPGAGADPDLGYQFYKKYGMDRIQMIPTSFIYHLSKQRATRHISEITLMKPMTNADEYFHVKNGISIAEFDRMLKYD